MQFIGSNISWILAIETRLCVLRVVKQLRRPVHELKHSTGSDIKPGYPFPYTLTKIATFWYLKTNKQNTGSLRHPKALTFSIDLASSAKILPLFWLD